MNDLRTTVAWALLAGPLTAFAQTGVRPDSTDPRLGTPAPAAESAFAGYRSFRDEPLAPWREVNDEVGRRDGHMGQMKDEASGAAQPPSAPAAGEPQRRSDAPGGPKHAH